MSKRRELKTALVTALILLSVAVRAEITVFTGARIVRPEIDAITPPLTVVIDGRRIEAIGPAAEIVVPTGATVIEANGAYLLPGLAEMHAHVPRGDADTAYLEDVLFLWVAHGVTTIRGMNGEAAHLELRDRIDAGEVLGPRLITAGPAFMGRAIKTAPEASARVGAQSSAGYDFIKVHMGLPRSIYDAVAAAAAAQGIPVAGHVAEGIGLWHALQARQASIDHLDSYLPALVPPDAETGDVGYGFLGAPLTPFVESDRIDMVAHSTRVAGVWNVPTLSMAEKFVVPVDPEDPALGLEYMPAKLIKGWSSIAAGFQKSIDDPAEMQRFLQIRQQLVKTLNDVGAGLLLGSDAPQVFNVPGFSLHRELELLVEAGLTPAEALTTGTLNPAIYFARSNEFGRVAPGLDADLVLVGENPLEDLASLREPLGVMLRGRWLSGAELRAGLGQIAARNRAE